jgi:hypothetical protein
MNMPSHDSPPVESESGQAAALMALLLFFAFLAFAALAIDGAMTYSVRRDLQNVADSATLAACRVIASHDTSTTPLAAAENAIAAHLGSWAQFAGSNPPSTNEGASASLLKGIEVSEPEVRVALQRRVPTVLTQFLGRGDSIMVAQARCDSRAGGGLLPIAVQRYDGGTGGTMTDYVANKSAPIYPTDSVTATWAGRYGPFNVPVPTSPWIASDGALADSNTGPEVLLLGSSADTNNGESSMRDLVLLDIRNVASGNALEYYNGANSQADAAKDMSREWIRQHGYPGPYPQVGSQVAILDGASNDFTTHAMINDAAYRPGDVVAAIVYDGFVWTRPDFFVTFKPQSGNGVVTSAPIDSSTAVAYTLRIDKAGPASAGWYAPQNFNLKFVFNNGPLPAGTHMTINGVELTGPNYTHSVNNVSSAGWGGTVRIWNTEAITIGQYLTGINLIAESGLGQVHGPDPSASQYVQFGFWNGANIIADYAARSTDGKLFVRQGGSYQANLVAHGVGASFPSGSGCTNVPVAGSVLLGGAPQSWNTFFSSSANTTIDIKKNTDKSTNLPLNVNTGALIGNAYVLRLTVGPKTCSGKTVPARTVDIPLEVQPPAPTATPDKFVVIQGYAVFRVSRHDANDVWAYAISPLYERYEDITYGLRPRLVPWQ